MNLQIISITNIQITLLQQPEEPSAVVMLEEMQTQDTQCQATRLPHIPD